MNYFTSYSILFAAGYFSCLLGTSFLTGELIDVDYLGFCAGLSAVLSALALTLPYVNFLQTNKHLKLYLVTALGVFLSHIIFGLIMGIIEPENFAGAFILYFAISVFAGVISNLILSFIFTTSLIHIHKKRSKAFKIPNE